MLGRLFHSFRKEELQKMCELANITVSDKPKVADMIRLLLSFARANPDTYQSTLSLIAPASPYDLSDELTFPIVEEEDTDHEKEEKVGNEFQTEGTSKEDARVLLQVPTQTKKMKETQQSNSNDLVFQMLLQQQQLLQQQIEQNAILVASLTENLQGQRLPRTEEAGESLHQKKVWWEKFLSRVASLNKSWNGNARSRAEAMIYLRAFEELLEQYAPDWNTTLAGLRDSLNGKAKEWFMVHRKTFNSYDDFKGKFFEAFLPQDYEVMVKEQLRGEKQKPNETLRDFHT